MWPQQGQQQGNPQGNPQGGQQDYLQQGNQQQGGYPQQGNQQQQNGQPNQQQGGYQQQGAQQQNPQQNGQQNYQQNGQQQQGGSPFSSIESADVAQNSEFFADGNYVVRLGSWVWKEARKGNMLIVETEVLANYSGHGNHVGSRPTIFIKQNDSFLGNVKALIIAASGFDPSGNPRPVTDTVTQQEADAAKGPEQIYNGAIVNIDAFTKMTRTNNEFTVLNYTPAVDPGQQQPQPQQSQQQGQGFGAQEPQQQQQQQQQQQFQGQQGFQPDEPAF